MNPRHIALGVLVAVIWGVGFVANKTALESFSPSQLLALRFLISSIPVLFLPPPAVPWSVLIPIGLTLFAAQFLFQFLGLTHGMPVGLSAIAVQTQAVFTVVLAALLLHEWPTRRELVGIAAGVTGLALIAATIGSDLSVLGFALTMVSPVVFAVGNILLKRVHGVDMLSLTVWLCLVPPLPALVLSMIVDGPFDLARALLNASWPSWAAILYVSVLSTILAYAIWGDLLRRYSAAAVAPFALLVPFVGAIASALILGERFGPLRLAGMACVLLGLTIIVLPRSAPRIPPA